VKLTFDELESRVNIVNLVNFDVPDKDRYENATVVENTKMGWLDIIFHKMRV
ncbi:hypothetical protein Csa_018427, partial [Cucumis sativus]